MSSFRYESDMTELVSDWLQAQDLMVKSEYPTPSGPCDLVGVGLRPKAVRNRLAMGQTTSILDEDRLAVLEVIPDSAEGVWVPHDVLREELAGFLDLEGILAAAQWLESKSFIKSGARGFRRLNGWAPLEHRVIAVELKLHRVRDAVRQASSHHCFASEVAIALPFQRAHAAIESDVEGVLRALGVGVIGVNPTGCEFLLRPRAQEASSHPVLRALCVERFWGASLRA